MQLAAGGNVLLDTERDLQDLILRSPNNAPCPFENRASSCIACQHRFTDQQRRLQLLDRLDYPTMMLFCPIEESDQRSRTGQPPLFHGRIMALELQGGNGLNHPPNMMFTIEKCVIKISGCVTLAIQSVVRRSVGPYSQRERLALRGDSV